MDTPVGQLMNVVVDCPDAGVSARFWAAVLGWERVQENAGSVDIADPSDPGRRLVFQQIADHRPPGWPAMVARRSADLPEVAHRVTTDAPAAAPHATGQLRALQGRRLADGGPGSRGQ